MTSEWLLNFTSLKQISGYPPGHVMLAPSEFLLLGAVYKLILLLLYYCHYY